MKKLFAILLTLVLVLMMGASAFAVDTITITAPNNAPDNGAATTETYTAYKIFDVTKAADATPDSGFAYSIAEGNEWLDEVQALSTYVTLTPSEDGTFYTVKWVSSETDAKNFAAALKNSVEGKENYITIEAGQSTEVTPGYYLITSTAGAALIAATTADIEIKDKNEYPTIVKEVDKKTADLGSILTFTITVTVPKDATGTIVVHDTMTNLAYGTMTAPTTGVTAESSELSDGWFVKFTIDADTVATAAGGTVVIQYTATMTDETATNEAYLVNNKFESKPVTTVTKSFSIPVYKFTGPKDNKTGLAGATFKLQKAENEYYKLENGAVTWVDDKDINNKATTYTTAAETFTVTFTGLAAGTYNLIETEAPAGYNKLTAPITVEITENGIVKVGSSEVPKVEVENNTGSSLPETGGIGTTIFYVVGGLLMAAAVVLLVTKKITSSGK